MADHHVPLSSQRLSVPLSELLHVPRHRLGTYGRQAFSVAVLSAWNSLPHPVLNRNATAWHQCTDHSNAGVISNWTRGNAVPVVRTRYGRHCEPFSDQKKCTRLQYFAHTVSENFSGMIPSDPAEAPPSPALGPRHQFPRGSPVFPLFQFYETTTALRGSTDDAMYTCILARK